jgi:hypothetical protein
MLVKKNLETNLIRLFSRAINQSNGQPSHSHKCPRTWTNKKERCLNRSSCNLWIIQLGMDGWICVWIQLASKLTQFSCLHLMKTRHPPCPPSCSQQKKTPKTKSLSPSLSNLKFGRFLFSVGRFFELPVLVPKSFKVPIPVQFQFILRNWNLVLVSISVLKPSFKLVCFRVWVP